MRRRLFRCFLANFGNIDETGKMIKFLRKLGNFDKTAKICFKSRKKWGYSDR